MPYGVKYSGSDASVDGSTYTAEILENGYSGSVTTIVLSKPAVVVYWGQQGDDVYTPIRPSSAEIMVFDPSKALQGDLLSADEEKFRLHIKKGANDYWLGKIVMDGFQDSLNLVSESIKITAIDGLGQLDGLDFDDTTRVSIVQCGADLLAKIGLGLHIRFASNWFTPDISSDQDPLHEIYTERIAERGDQDALLSAKAVFEEYLTRFGLQLHQSGGIWRVTQRELLGGSGYTYFEYDSTGAFVASDIEIPSVTMTADAQYGKRLKDGQGTYKPAYETTTVLYVPKPGQDNLVINGSFEDWTSELPEGWTATDDLGVISKSSQAADGVNALSIIARYNLNANVLPTDYLAREVGLVNGGMDALQIRISAQAIKNPNVYTPPVSKNPRKAYFKVLYGGYYLHRAGDGTVTWVAVGQGGQYDDYILLNNAGCSALYLGWQEDLLVTPAVPVASGQLRIELYPLTEFEFTPGQEQTTAAFVGILYDNIIVMPITVSTGLKTVSTSVVLPNTVNRDSVQFRIGDGPNTATPSHLTIGASTLTSNWKRGPYSGQDPTGKSIDAMCTETWLRAQKQPLEIHNATYTARAAAGALIEVHNVLVIGTKHYAFTYLERDLIAGHSTGEWVEIRADDSDMLTTVEAIVEENGTNVVNTDTKYGDSNVVGSQTFASGLAGSGWRIEKIGNRYKFFIDDLEVRGTMTVAELLFMQKRVFNGSWITARSGTGKPSRMEEIPLA